MRKSDKRKNILEANQKLMESFDIDRYEKTSQGGYGELRVYLDTLNLTEDEKNRILSIATSYADDMWREGAQGGFADR